MKSFKKYTSLIFIAIVAVAFVAVSKIEAVQYNGPDDYLGIFFTYMEEWETNWGGYTSDDRNAINICDIPVGGTTCSPLDVFVAWYSESATMNRVSYKVSSATTWTLFVTSGNGTYGGTLTGDDADILNSYGRELIPSSLLTIANSPITFKLSDTSSGLEISDTITAQCESGSYWSTSSGKCVASPSGTLYSLPTAHCEIDSGDNSCDITLQWEVSDPLSGANTAVTTPTNVTVGTGTSGSKTYSVDYGSRYFFLYHNGEELAEKQVTATCASGTEYDEDSGTCKAPSVTLSLVDDNNVTIPTSEGNYFQKVGTSFSTLFGLRSTSAVPSGEPVKITWDAKGFDEDTVECTMPNGEIINDTYGYTVVYPTSTTTYSITCTDENTETTEENTEDTNVDLAPYSIVIHNVYDPYNDSYLDRTSGTTFYYNLAYDSDGKNVYMNWVTGSNYTCSDISHSLTSVTSEDNGNNLKIWTWDGNEYTDISGTTTIKCTNSSLGTTNSFYYKFYDCVDDDLCSLIAY